MPRQVASGRASATRLQNILTKSEDFSGWGASNATVNANAVTAPNGTLTADALVENTTAAQHFFFQYFTNFQRSWNTFAYSCYVKKGTRNWAAMIDGNTGVIAYFDLVNGVVGTVAAGFYNAEIEPASLTIPGASADWWRIKAIYAPIATAARRIDIASASANGGAAYAGTAGAEAIYVWGAQVESRNFVGPYQVTTDAQVLGNVRNRVGTRENFFAYSYDLSNNLWTTDGAAIAYPVAGMVAPDGYQRVSKITENGAAGARHRVNYLSLPTSAFRGAGYYTFSGYFHGGTRRYVALYVQDDASSYAIFDLQNGVVASISSTIARAQIRPVTGMTGWYRCWVTTRSSTSVANAQLYLSNGTQIIYNGDNSSYIYAFGLQHTFANQPGNYTSTNGAAVFTEELRNLATPFTLVNRVTDGDMEAAGTTAWTAANNCTPTKETSGSPQGAQYLKLACTQAYSEVYQTALVAGKTYLVTGRCKGDGANGIPYIGMGSGNFRAVGTNSTSWQTFNLVTTAIGNTVFYLASMYAGAATIYFDDITVIDLDATPTRRISTL
jgi:hypothetical protein